MINTICPTCKQPVTHTDVALSLWYMYDCHAFKRLSGSTVDAILQEATEAAAEAGDSGMLCPARIVSGNTTLRALGVCAHARSGVFPADQLDRWRAALEADTECMVLLAQRATALPEDAKG